MYLINTRPDITFVVSKVSRYMERHTQTHWEAAKRILKYIKGTIHYEIAYSKESSFILKGYSYSDYAGNVDDSKSTSDFIFHLGSGPISWQFKKQNVVALSSIEAEYIVLSMTGCPALWLKGILKELHIKNRSKVLCHKGSECTYTHQGVAGQGLCTTYGSSQHTPNLA